MTRTFLDAGVLIAASRGADELAKRALAFLDDPEREFISTPFLKLELLPQPTYNRRSEEVGFMNEFLNSAEHFVSASEELVTLALKQAEQFGLDALDALHVAAALQAGAKELITAEKASKPLCRVTSLKVVTIRTS